VVVPTLRCAEQSDRFIVCVSFRSRWSSRTIDGSEFRALQPFLTAKRTSGRKAERYPIVPLGFALPSLTQSARDGRSMANRADVRAYRFAACIPPITCISAARSSFGTELD